jgi:hypothetical protein
MNRQTPVPPPFPARLLSREGVTAARSEQTAGVALTPMSPASANPLPRPPDPAILRIARALARQLAREDHTQQTGRPIEEEKLLYCRRGDDS